MLAFSLWACLLLNSDDNIFIVSMLAAKHQYGSFSLVNMLAAKISMLAFHSKHVSLPMLASAR